MPKSCDSAGDDALFSSIEKSPIATVITNPRVPDNPIVAANSAFCSLTGYRIDEVVGRNCRFLNTAGQETEQRKLLRSALDSARPALVELVNYRKDGSAFRNAVMVAPLLGEDGDIAWFVGSQMDVTEKNTPPLPRPAAQALVAQLTPRQRQVLECVVTGFRNKQIASYLGISEKTVKMHRKGMLLRLGATTSADAIRIGVEAGLVQRER